MMNDGYQNLTPFLMKGRRLPLFLYPFTIATKVNLKRAKIIQTLTYSLLVMKPCLKLLTLNLQLL